MTLLRSLTLVAAILCLAPVALAQQSFTCSIGEPACIQYHEKVVDQKSTCFKQFTCVGDRFVCEWDYQRLGRKYDENIDDYNELVADYNSLLDYTDALEDCIAQGRDLASVKACL